MKAVELAKLVTGTLEEYKALRVTDLDVTTLTDIADRVIICSATSRRHAGALADRIIHRTKGNGVQPLSVQGETEAEWILIDLCDIILHIMLPEIRGFYNLEQLWSMTESSSTYKN